MPDKLLRRKIMKRVYVIWFFRVATSPPVLETLAFVGGFLWLTSYISFKNVLMNVSPTIGSPVSLAGFFVSAFSATEFISKILIVSIMTLFTLLMKDLAPSIVRNIISGMKVMLQLVRVR